MRSEITELKPLFTKFQGDQTCHTGGIFTTVGFRHHIFGNKPVFTDNIGYTGKCSTVTQRIAEEPFHHFIIHRLTAGVDNTLQKEISFLQLIEEERISLRKFERTEVMLGDRFGTHHIQTCEKPATAGRFLIGDTFGRHFDGEMCVHPFQVILIESQFTNVVATDSVADSLVSRSVCVTLLDLLHHGVADASFHFLRLCRIRKST